MRARERVSVHACTLFRSHAWLLSLVLSLPPARSRLAPIAHTSRMCVVQMCMRIECARARVCVCVCLYACVRACTTLSRSRLRVGPAEIYRVFLENGTVRYREVFSFNAIVAIIGWIYGVFEQRYNTKPQPILCRCFFRYTSRAGTGRFGIDTMLHLPTVRRPARYFLMYELESTRVAEMKLKFNMSFIL